MHLEDKRRKFLIFAALDGYLFILDPFFRVGWSAAPNVFVLSHVSSNIQLNPT